MGRMGNERRMWTMGCLTAILLLAHGMNFAQAAVGVTSLAPPPSTEIKKWAVLIGADQYDDPGIAALPDAANDAAALRDALSGAGSGFAKEQVAVLAHDRATRSVIIVAIKDAAMKAGPKDLLYFHYSGSALKSDTGELILATKDTSMIDPMNTGLSFGLVADALAASAAAQIFISIDSPNAGAAASAMGKFLNKDVLLVTSCGAGEVSFSAPEFRQGALTHFLLEGLSGKADKTQNGIITGRELADYARDTLVPWLAAKTQNATPMVAGAGGQFAIIGKPGDSALAAATPPVEGGAGNAAETSDNEPVLPMPAVTAPAPGISPAVRETAGGGVSSTALAPLTPAEPVFSPSVAPENATPNSARISAPTGPGDTAYLPPVTTPPPAQTLPAVLPTPVQITDGAEAVDIQARQKWALVVGVNQYLSPNWPALPASLNDASLMQETLVKNLGFAEDHVKVLTDTHATQANIMANLREITGKAQADDLIFFYFSGHSSRLPNPMGYKEEGRWFVLCPQDTQSTGQGLLAFPLITGVLTEAKAKQIVVVLDCVNSGAAGPFMGKLSEQGKNWLLLAGCGPEQTAADRPMKQPSGQAVPYSVFTYYFANGAQGDAAKEGPLTAMKLMRYTQTQLQQSGLDQAPQLLGQPAGLVLAGAAPKELSDETVLSVSVEAPKPAVDEATAKIKKWALVVGINKYKDASLPELPGAVNDSKDVRDLLSATLGFEKGAVTVLNDDKATRKGILDALQEIGRKADAEDTVLVYFSGHSMLTPKLKNDIESENELVLCTSDANLADPTSALPTRELCEVLTTFTTKQNVVILETSHAAAAGQFAERATQSGKKCAMIAGCGWGEATFDASIPLESGKTKKQGAFTYFLTQGLHGDASKKGSKYVTLKEATAFAVEKLKAQGFKQKPQLSGEAADFVLAASGAAKTAPAKPAADPKKAPAAKKEEPAKKDDAAKAAAPKASTKTDKP